MQPESFLSRLPGTILTSSSDSDSSPPVLGAPITKRGASPDLDLDLQFRPRDCDLSLSSCLLLAARISRSDGGGGGATEL